MADDKISKAQFIYDTSGVRTQGLGIQAHTNLNLGSQVGFSEHFKFQDAFINNHGEIVIHETAIACPQCRVGADHDTLLSGMSCSSCQGDGYIHVNPRRIPAIITGISGSRRLVETGLLEAGDCTMSVSPKLFPPITELDKITATWPQPASHDGEIIVRGDHYRLQQDRGGEQWLTADHDRLNYEGVVAIHVQDENGVVYYQDVDFVFEGKTIKWVGNSPVVRTRFTIKYMAYLEWIAFNSPTERRAGGMNVGQRVVLRKRHIALLDDDPREETAEEAVNSSNGFFPNNGTII